MKKRTILLILLVLFVMPVASAEDITMSVEQSDYYFLVGQDAVIPLTYNNTYDKQIDGQLKYTITQEVNQGGFYYSSTNSQQTSFFAEKGEHTINLGFGTSDSPAILKVTMTLSYSYDQEERSVTLDQIIIHFVSNESQMNNQQNKMESSSEKVANGQQNQPSQQPSQQTPQQKLQNNQMSQDSQALKEQLEKQLQEQQQMKEEFQKNLFNNSDFQDINQELLEQGYNITSSDLNPTDNNSGNFSFEYQKEDGETATLQGEMNNGELENVQKLTAEDKQRMLDQLNQNEEFKKYNEQLGQDGFNQTNVEFTQEGNKTNVRLNYMDKNNKTAAITAEFQDGVLQNVGLEKEQIQNMFPWFLLIAIVFICVVAFFIYIKFIKKTSGQDDKDDLIKEEPYDYITEANKLLDEAKILFDKKKYKDAYGKSAQALRLFLSYDHGLNKELTNDDIVKYLKRNNKSYKEIKECFDLCSLVEFAKYQANKKDFSKILGTTKKTINTTTLSN